MTCICFGPPAADCPSHGTLQPTIKPSTAWDADFDYLSQTAANSQLDYLAELYGFRRLVDARGLEESDADFRSRIRK